MSLKLKIDTYGFRYCESGHMTHSRNGTVDGNNCSICGAAFVTGCEECGTRLQTTFQSSTFLGTARPRNAPERPGHCGKCGHPYPWTLKEQELAAASVSSDALTLLRQICSRFHLVAKQLRGRHDHRATLDVDDEYDVQDLLHALLRIHFDDVRAEECTPSYAGGSSRIDFLIKDESIGLEVKKTRKALRDKDIGNQLIEDIARYKQHPECNTLVCFVYDPEGRISNPNGLQSDLARVDDGFSVEVIIVPKGY